MNNPNRLTPGRPRPVFQGPTYTTPQYHSRIWGRIIFIFLILLLVGIGVVGGGLYWGLHRAQGNSAQAVTIHVGPGDSVNSIADELSTKGLIDSTLLFKLDARIRNLGGKLKPGDYTLRHDMSIDDMVAALGVYHLVQISIRILPGDRYAQIADALQSKGIDARSFLQEVEHPEAAYLQVPDLLKDKSATATLEGYLFPDTYNVDPHSSGRAFAREMVHQMDVEISPQMRGDIRRQGRSIFRVLTLASLVEREAGAASDRPKIASVYFNRLTSASWPTKLLQADPTVQYAAGKPGNWWPNLQPPLTAIVPNSPYNTYVQAGWPPGPIASPSLASIQAAIHPAPTPFFYFVHIPCSHGHSAFASTLAEQEANQQQYPPRTCK